MYRNRLTRVEENNGEWITKDYIELNSSKRLVKKKFRKVYDGLFEVYSQLNGSEPKVLSWLVLNSNKQNFVKISYKELSNKLNLSLIRIKEIMKKLQKLNVVKNTGGIIYINPFMFIKDGSKEETLQIEYMPIFKEELNAKDI